MPNSMHYFGGFPCMVWSDGLLVLPAIAVLVQIGMLILGGRLWARGRRRIPLLLLLGAIAIGVFAVMVLPFKPGIACMGRSVIWR